MLAYMYNCMRYIWKFFTDHSKNGIYCDSSQEDEEKHSKFLYGRQLGQHAYLLNIHPALTK